MRWLGSGKSYSMMGCKSSFTHFAASMPAFCTVRWAVYACRFKSRVRKGDALDASMSSPGAEQGPPAVFSVFAVC